MHKRPFLLIPISLLALTFLRAEPIFNRTHGVYKTPFMLRISSGVSGTIVRYTLDGSDPTTASPQFTGNIYVDSTMIVRAAEYKDGVRCSDIVTSSYIFPTSVLQQPSEPDGYPTIWGKYTTISGTAPADYGMDPELTSDRTYAKCITDAFYTIPALSIVTDKNNLFNKTYDEQTGGIYIYTGTSDSDGRGWERAASVELMGEGHGGKGQHVVRRPAHVFRKAQ